MLFFQPPLTRHTSSPSQDPTASSATECFRNTFRIVFVERAVGIVRERERDTHVSHFCPPLTQKAHPCLCSRFTDHTHAAPSTREVSGRPSTSSLFEEKLTPLQVFAKIGVSQHTALSSVYVCHVCVDGVPPPGYDAYPQNRTIYILNCTNKDGMASPAGGYLHTLPCMLKQATVEQTTRRMHFCVSSKPSAAAALVWSS